MLLAITGPSGAGKGGASLVAEDALFIDEPEINFMKPERIPVRLLAKACLRITATRKKV